MINLWMEWDVWLIKFDKKKEQKQIKVVVKKNQY